jgi:hypothetical protein
MRKIHITMKIKKLTKLINEDVDLNFGYTPSNDPAFDRMLEERTELMDKLNKIDPVEYKKLEKMF